MSDGNESDIMPSRIVAKMGKLDSNDMGKGRRTASGDESSSSRESSPGKMRKRSFSPNSDDGDFVIPQVEDDDTPPPNAPILRQAVAFSPWDNSASAPRLNTYEAPDPSRPAINPSCFLPGQEVPVSTPPAPPPLPKGTNGNKKKSRGKTRHYNDKFSDKTGSFRLKGYANDPKTTRLGKRPYAQMYPTPETTQAVGSQSTASTSSPASTQVSLGFNSMGSHGTTATTASSAAPLHISSAGLNVSSHPINVLANNPVPSTSAVPTTTTNNSAASPNVITTLPSNATSPSRARSRRPRPISVNQRSSSSNRFNAERTCSSPSTSRVLEPRVDQHASTNPTVNNTGPHYRRDYDRDTDLASSAPSHTRASHSPSPNAFENSSQPTNTRNPNSVVASQNPGSGTSNETANRSSDLVQVVRVTRMVTLLIEDVRSGTSDPQLAEVKVPLRPADDPEDGFWADAKDICQILQSGPSRIDGPARAYTHRGKYRQFFLRVSADNVDNTETANLIVSKHRTLDITVEALLPPDGSLPPRPITPQRLIRAPPLDRDSSHSSSASPDLRSRDINHKSRRKRKRSYSYSSGHDSNVDSSSTSRRGHHRRRTSSPITQSPSQKRHLTSAEQATPPDQLIKNKIKHRMEFFPDSLRTKDGGLPMWAQIPPSREPTPQPDATPDQIHEAVSKSIQPDIWKDDYWVDFMRLKAMPPPLTVPDTLNQYRFAQKKVNEWRGRIAPFRSARFVVEKSHVLMALFMDERWGSECTETLELIELYGPDGEHYEDPRIAGMLEDKSVPKGRPAKRLLRLLREIHQNWLKER